MTVKILYFIAEWSEMCEKTRRVLEQMKTAYKRTEVDIQKIDIESNQNTARRYSVTNIPTIIFLGSGGGEIFRLVGENTRSVIRDKIKLAQKLDQANPHVSKDTATHA